MTDRPVDDDVADPGDDAAEHGGVDDDLHFDVLAGGMVQRLAQPLDLVGRERDRAADLGDRAPVLGRRELDEPVDDLGQLAGATGRRRRTPRARRSSAAPCAPSRSSTTATRRSAGSVGSLSAMRSSSDASNVRAKRKSSSSTSAEATLGAGDLEHRIARTPRRAQLDGTVSCSLPG